MKHSQMGLASSTVALTDRFLGEPYADTTNELNESLRGSETSPEEAIENRELLDEIIAKFPRRFGSHLLEYIEAQSAAEAKWLQASVVWSNPRFLRATFSMPSYVIGSTSNGRRTNLLIHGLYRSGIVNPYETNAPLLKRGALQTATVSTKRYREWHPDTQPTADTQLSIDELNRFRGLNGYILGRDSSKLPIPKDSKLSDPMMGITNETLATYSVFEHIGGLAIAFSKVQEVQQTIADHQSS